MRITYGLNMHETLTIIICPRHRLRHRPLHRYYNYYYYFACKSVVFKSTLLTYKYSNRLSKGKKVSGISTSLLFERSLYI